METWYCGFAGLDLVAKTQPNQYRSIFLGVCSKNGGSDSACTLLEPQDVPTRNREESMCEGGEPVLVCGTNREVAHHHSADRLANEVGHEGTAVTALELPVRACLCHSLHLSHH